MGKNEDYLLSFLHGGIRKKNEEEYIFFSGLENLFIFNTQLEFCWQKRKYWRIIFLKECYFGKK